MKPLKTRKIAFHRRKFSIRLKVTRFFSELSKNSAMANEKNTETKAIFFCGGVSNGSISSSPVISPNRPPKDVNTSECHSTTIPMKKIVNEAALNPEFGRRKLLSDTRRSPQDWIISEKSLATVGSTFNASVITGKATAPPPSVVIPKSEILSRPRLRTSDHRSEDHHQRHHVALFEQGQRSIL